MTKSGPKIKSLIYKGLSLLTFTKTLINEGFLDHLFLVQKVKSGPKTRFFMIFCLSSCLQHLASLDASFTHRQMKTGSHTSHVSPPLSSVVHPSGKARTAQPSRPTSHPHSYSVSRYQNPPTGAVLSSVRRLGDLIHPITQNRSAGFLEPHDSSFSRHDSSHQKRLAPLGSVRANNRQGGTDMYDYR